MQTVYAQFTSGWEGEKLVIPNKAYTNAANFAAFAASSADGDFGVFKPDGTLVSAALSVGDLFFFAVKRDGLVDKTTIMTYDTTLDKAKTAGTAGTAQVTTVVVSCGGNLSCADPNSCCTNSLQDFVIELIDTQTSDQPVYDSWKYFQQGQSPKKIIDVLTTLRTKINDTTSRTNTIRGRKATMSAVTTGGGATSDDPFTYTFTLTGTDTKPFKVAIKGFAGITITPTTVAVEPLGSLAMMKELEYEAMVREGWTTKYLEWPFISSEFGEPTLFTNSTASTTFTQYMFRQNRYENSLVSGVGRHHRVHKVEVAAPNGSPIVTSMNTIFAL